MIVDFKGHMIVGSGLQRFAFHRRNPYRFSAISDQEEALLGDGEGFRAAVIDLAGIEHTREDLLHPIEIGNDESHVTQSANHGFLPLHCG